MKRKMLLLTLALPVILLQDTQAQTSSRLVSSAHWQSTGVAYSPLDSSEYHYSNGRGGSMNFGPTRIDDVNSYPQLPLMYDNAAYWGFIGDSGYVSQYYVQTFDSHNNVTSTLTQDNSGAPLSNTLYTYDAGNRLVKMEDQTWGGTSWVSYTRHLYAYNSAGKLSIDSVQSWDGLTSSWYTSNVHSYYYDGAQNLINITYDVWVSGSPVHSDMWSRTYSSTNQLLTSTYSTWNGTGWINQLMYTHAYDVMGDPISLLLQFYNSGTMVWDNNTLWLYSNFNSSHMPQTATQQSWDNTGTGSWVNNMQYTYTYNSFNQVTSVNGISWNITSGLYQLASGDPRETYYYELYNTTAVQNVTTAGSSVNIYPVPAANTLHVDLNWNEAQAATISVMNITGAVVKQWNTAAGAKANSAVSVADLAPGTYFVKVMGEKEQIVKQIVVAH